MKSSPASNSKGKRTINNSYSGGRRTSVTSGSEKSGTINSNSKSSSGSSAGESRRTVSNKSESKSSSESSSSNDKPTRRK